MRVFILFFAAIIAVSYGKPTLNSEVQVYAPKKLGIKLNQIVSEETLAELSKAFADDGSVDDIDLNVLLDGFLESLKSMIIDNGMDPLALDDQTLQLLGIVGSIKLTSGWLQDLSTITRYDDVIVSYNSAAKKVTFTLPLNFKVLLFTYKYVTRVTLLTIDGDVQGKINDVYLNLQVTYDREGKQLILDGLDMKDSGKVTVKFTGNALVDWVTNAMTSVVTTVLHPLIISVLEATVRSIGIEVIDEVNKYINDVA